jgi:starch synthase
VSPLAQPESGATVALLPWGDLLEDFLDPLGLDVQDYADTMTGGWLFGYVDALARADVRPVIVCVSARVTSPVRLRHRHSGCPIWVLPATRPYRAVRRLLAEPYAWDRHTASGNRTGPAALPAAAARHLAPYLSTPVRPLLRVLRSEGCDAVLCQEYEEARFDVVALLGRATGVSVSATFQGGTAARTGLERLLRVRTLRLARSLVVASTAEESRLQRQRRVAAAQIAAIPNPLDLQEWALGDRGQARQRLGLPEAARIVVWHGRVEVRRKGLDVLLDGWEQLLAAHPDADLRLLMVGTGPDAAQVRQRLADRPLRGLRWLDRYTLDRTELRDHLHAADVAVLSSRQEGFAVAPLEAMACGVPVVATDVPGVRDLLPRGEQDGGLVVPVEDAGALAAALALLVLDLPRARRAGVRARARAEQAYSLDSVGRQLRRALLGDCARAAP